MKVLHTLSYTIFNKDIAHRKGYYNRLERFGSLCLQPQKKLMTAHYKRQQSSITPREIIIYRITTIALAPITAIGLLFQLIGSRINQEGKLRKNFVGQLQQLQQGSEQEQHLCTAIQTYSQFCDTHNFTHENSLRGVHFERVITRQLIERALDLGATLENLEHNLVSDDRKEHLHSCLAADPRYYDDTPPPLPQEPVPQQPVEGGYPPPQDVLPKKPQNEEMTLYDRCVAFGDIPLFLSSLPLQDGLRLYAECLEKDETMATTLIALIAESDHFHQAYKVIEQDSLIVSDVLERLSLDQLLKLCSLDGDDMPSLFSKLSSEKRKAVMQRALEVNHQLRFPLFKLFVTDEELYDLIASVSENSRGALLQMVDYNRIIVLFNTVPKQFTFIKMIETSMKDKSLLAAVVIGCCEQLLQKGNGGYYTVMRNHFGDNTLMKYYLALYDDARFATFAKTWHKHVEKKWGVDEFHAVVSSLSHKERKLLRDQFSLKIYSLVEKVCRRNDEKQFSQLISFANPSQLLISLGERRDQRMLTLIDTLFAPVTVTCLLLEGKLVTPLPLFTQYREVLPQIQTFIEKNSKLCMVREDPKKLYAFLKESGYLADPDKCETFVRNLLVLLSEEQFNTILSKHKGFAPLLFCAREWFLCKGKEKNILRTLNRLYTHLEKMDVADGAKYKTLLALYTPTQYDEGLMKSVATIMSAELQKIAPQLKRFGQ